MRKLVLVVFCALATMAWADGNVVKMLAKMEQLRMEHRYIEAMDTAVRVLVESPNNRVAINYVHDQWDKVVKEANRLMEENADELSLDESLVRLEVCRLMADIAENLRGVDMPLSGPNQSWVWYPEVYYSQGDYESERIHVYRLLVGYAELALRSYDADGARKYYMQALRYLYPGKEKQSNVATICKDLIRQMNKLGNTTRIPDAIFAYDMSALALAMDSTQDSVKTLQPILQQHVSDLYLQRSAELAAEGDSLKAADYREYAIDWCVTNCPK